MDSADSEGNDLTKVSAKIRGVWSKKFKKIVIHVARNPFPAMGYGKRTVVPEGRKRELEGSPKNDLLARTKTTLSQSENRTNLTSYGANQVSNFENDIMYLPVL